MNQIMIDTAILTTLETPRKSQIWFYPIIRTRECKSSFPRHQEPIRLQISKWKLHAVRVKEVYSEIWTTSQWHNTAQAAWIRVQLVTRSPNHRIQSIQSPYLLRVHECQIYFHIIAIKHSIKQSIFLLVNVRKWSGKTCFGYASM